MFSEDLRRNGQPRYGRKFQPQSRGNLQKKGPGRIDPASHSVHYTSSVPADILYSYRATFGAAYPKVGSNHDDRLQK